MVAAELGRLQERERFLERELRTAQSNPDLTSVQLDEQGSTTKFDDTFIENLPVPGRFYQNVLSMAPGVQDADGDGNPNVHGSRQRDVKAEVSGISNRTMSVRDLIIIQLK